MKSTIRFILSFLIICFCFSSCTIEKRHYQPGYFVDWNYKKGNRSQNHSVANRLKATNLNSDRKLEEEQDDDPSSNQNVFQQSNNLAASSAEIEVIPHRQIASTETASTNHSLSNINSKRAIHKALKNSSKPSNFKKVNNKKSSNQKRDPLFELLIFLILGGANFYGLNYRPTVFGVILSLVFLFLILWTFTVILFAI